MKLIQRDNKILFIMIITVLMSVVIIDFISSIITYNDNIERSKVRLKGGRSNAKTRVIKSAGGSRGRRDDITLNIDNDMFEDKEEW